MRKTTPTLASHDDRTIRPAAPPPPSTTPPTRDPLADFGRAPWEGGSPRPGPTPASAGLPAASQAPVPPPTGWLLDDVLRPGEPAGPSGALRAVPAVREEGFLSGEDDSFDACVGWTFEKVADAAERAFPAQAPPPPPLPTPGLATPEDLFGPRAMASGPLPSVHAPTQPPPSAVRVPSPAFASGAFPRPLGLSIGPLPPAPTPEPTPTHSVEPTSPGPTPVETSSAPTAPSRNPSVALSTTPPFGAGGYLAVRPVPPSPSAPPPAASAATSGTMPTEDIDAGLVEVRALLGDDRSDEALARIDRLERFAPGDARIATWREYTERRVGPALVEGLRVDRVPRLTRPRNQVPAAPGTPAGRIVDLIDGIRTIGKIRSMVPDLPGVGFYRTFSQLVTHGAMAWTDG